MATWDDVSNIATALPETTRSDSRLREWAVAGKMFIWERPLRKSDLRALGDAAPDGPILGVRVADEGVKFALIADDPGVFFTTPHFDGYSAILVRLDQISVDDLQELLVEAWLLRAPKKVAKAYLGGS
jgi:hypothetical protein